MKKQNKEIKSKSSKKVRDKKKDKNIDKNIVMFESKVINKYNNLAIEEYLKVTKLNPVSFWRDFGELIGFLKAHSKNAREAGEIMSLLDRILNIYIESGTYNGAKKKIQFKLIKISEKERQEKIKAFKEKMGIKEMTEIKKEDKAQSSYMG